MSPMGHLGAGDIAGPAVGFFDMQKQIRKEIDQNLQIGTWTWKINPSYAERPSTHEPRVGYVLIHNEGDCNWDLHNII